MNRWEDAVRFYRHAADIYTELGNPKNEGIARNNAAISLVQLQRYDEARQEILRAIECKRPFSHAAELWVAFATLHDLERAVGNAAAAESARGDAIAAFLAYRRTGGENHSTGGRLAAAVAQAVTGGDTAAVASQLAELGARADLPEELQALIPVLQKIVAGSREPALASGPGLYYQDAAEVRLLLEL